MTENTHNYIKFISCISSYLTEKVINNSIESFEFRKDIFYPDYIVCRCSKHINGELCRMNIVIDKIDCLNGIYYELKAKCIVDYIEREFNEYMKR